MIEYFRQLGASDTVVLTEAQTSLITSVNTANPDGTAVTTIPTGRPVLASVFPSVATTATALPAGSVQVSNLDKSPTLFHITVPVYAVANFSSETLTGNLGVGTGIMFYDVGDKVNGGAAWPILVKAGLEYPLRDNMNIGGDLRFHYALTSPSGVDSIWGVRAGVKLTYFFQ